jgi:hypothetical protein
MATIATSPFTDPNQSGYIALSHAHDHDSPGISWAAVIGGAVAAAAMALTLLALGTGIGLSSVSPWSNAGASTSAVRVTAIVWLILSQIIASALGGYLAGRLRTKWVHVHTDETYFRDTAHGFLVWALGLVIAAAFLASAASSVAQRGTQTNAAGQSAADPNAYFVDSLLRSDAPIANQNETLLRAEVGRILANGLRQSELSPADNSYLTKLVAARTGLGPTESANRVSDVFAQAQLAADTARKAGAHLSYWTFFALLVGAFSASISATIGGRQRDHVIVT